MKRYCAIIFLFGILSVPPVVARDGASVHVGQIETEVCDTAVSAGIDNRQGDDIRHFALKSNLVYDALLMPSLELEWRINDIWSVSLEGDVAWWRNGGRHKYYQLAVIAPEVRRWFKTRGPWHGMYVGAFAGGGWYDLENGRTGYRGEGGMAGVSFGYMWPVTRVLSFEAAVGAGYMYTRYKEYKPHDGHYLYQRTKSINYFGPLKVKFALVWRFDINFSGLKRKGGAL